VRTIPIQLMQHYQSEVLRVAHLWRIVRVDGVVKRLTDHDDDIIFDGEIYSTSNALTPTALTTGGDMSVDNAEVAGVGSAGVVPAGAITEDEQLSGRYDGAEVWIYRVCYTNPEWGVETLKRGWLGTLSISPSSYNLELRGLWEAFQKPIGIMLQASCRADLGDYLCGVDVSAYTTTAVVTAVLDQQRIVCSSLSAADDYYLGGRALFLTGANEGLKTEVKHSTSEGALYLHTRMPGDIQVGDEISIHAGCDHTLKTCNLRFGNRNNYQGEPCINSDRNINPSV
jgi:uncharacterized phage protein (TIGR02218 family)